MSPELAAIGWKPWFQQQLGQLDEGDAEAATPVRVVEVQRSGLLVAPALPGFRELALGGRWYQGEPESRPTVGDWILVAPTSGSITHLLERTSLIKRLAPSGEIQLIAANIDTAFLVTSCNADFNPARLERYLAVVLEAEIQPVIVLTKADQCDATEPYTDAVRALRSDLVVECVNALAPDELDGLRAWCGAGQSIALLGSSGVGKSTLVNSLSGEAVQETFAARDGDDKGRHTTTHRSLHRLPDGGVILDSPGMREFQIADAQSGVEHVFDDIEALAQNCRFNDCAHQAEPGCAVRAALESGDLDERRLHSYFKLQREEVFNSESVAERHARYRQFGKMVRRNMQDKRKP